MIQPYDNMLSNHNGRKLEISDFMISGTPHNIWRQNATILDNLRVKEKLKNKLESILN